MRRAALTACTTAALACLLAACGSQTVVQPGPSTPAALPVGSSSHTIVVGGRTRTYLTYRPAALSGPAPLVVMLHGGFGTAALAERYYGWDAEADRGHFVVAYPDGLNRAWNTGGGCCGTPAKENVDDVGFITAVVSAVGRSVPIDPRRVYVTGISNGGIMAYALACRTRGVFAAIGPVAATQLGPCSTPEPISVLHIHGTADTNIPYDGSQGQGYAHIHGPSVPSVNATWRSIDGCDPPAVSTQGVVTTSTATCPQGRAVELITVDGAGHQWPGSASRPGIQRLLHIDPPSTAFDATAVLWAFFAAHPRPA